jgi:hypothetical protein
VISAGEPRLQQRRAGGEREERQADRGGEQAEEPKGLAALRRRAPALRDRERQHEHRRHHDRDVNGKSDLRPREPDQPVRIGVAREQRRLEEHHGDRPHRRGAAEPRQHHLGEHRLDHEQQRRAREHRRDVERAYQSMPPLRLHELATIPCDRSIPVPGAAARLV